ASEACHTWDSARPRPFWSRRTYSTFGWAAANAAPITGVESVLALSAMMIVSSVPRPVSAASSVSMETARPDSSLHRNDEVDRRGCHRRGGCWLRLRSLPGGALMSHELKASGLVGARHW